MNAEQDIRLTNEMQKIALQRTMLRDDFLLHPEERSSIQWHEKSEALRSLFLQAASRFQAGEEAALLEEAGKAFDATFSIFSGFIERHKGMDPASQKTAVIAESESGLIIQVFLKANTLIDNIDRLHDLSHKKGSTARNRGALLVVIVICGGIIAIIINSAFIGRILERRIETLGKGVEIIGTGDLDYRITAEGNDELSSLALAANEMAAKLKQSYASLEKLNEEIERRRLAEEVLKRYSEDLKRSNKELEQFAYVASHDLQEPLRMVASYTQLLAERYENQLDEKAKKFINYAVDGSVRMQLLINDLLAFSRIGTRGKPLEPVDAHAVMGEAINNLKMNIEETKTVITNDELPMVRADATQLAQLFQNLIGNAIKFRGSEHPYVHLSARDEGREWLFSVKDNGIGIDPEYADKVFVIFQRLHTKEEHPGSGIGLAICKKIVERHGGRIWIESGPGKGTTFYFTIPK
ncbi:MAG: sensor histidine kinase [Thermodesulfovibrionales bacterium]